MNTGNADTGICKTTTDSRHSTGQHKTVAAGPEQQQQQKHFQKPVVLTTNVVAAKAMTAKKMTATAVGGWCKDGEKREAVTLRSALMMSDAVAPALSS